MPIKPSRIWLFPHINILCWATTEKEVPIRGIGAYCLVAILLGVLPLSIGLWEKVTMDCCRTSPPFTTKYIRQVLFLVFSRMEAPSMWMVCCCFFSQVFSSRACEDVRSQVRLRNSWRATYRKRYTPGSRATHRNGAATRRT